MCCDQNTIQGNSFIRKLEIIVLENEKSRRKCFNYSTQEIKGK